MKKYFFTAAALLLAAACTRELPETPSPVNEGELVSFTIENARGPVLADKDQDGSRTALGNLTGSVVNWTAGDNAILFDNSGSCAGHLFTGSVQSDNTKINLSGEMHEGSTAYWLLYPYNSNASLSGGVITTTLSASQNAVAGSFADKTAISFAHGTRTPGQEVVDGLSFGNLCSVIAITIPTYVDNAKSVVITSNSGTAMAGNISFNTDGSLNSVSGSSSVTLSGTLSAGATYFAVVAPKDYANGFTLTLTTAGNNTYSASTTKTLEAKPGMIYTLGTLGLKLSNPAMSVYIHHTTDASGNLNGTDADLSVKVNNQNIPAELVAMATWDIVLKNSNNVIVRRYNSPNGTGEVVNGYVYLPQGSYTLSGTYTPTNSSPRSLGNINASSPKPSFNVNVTGYTSYDCFRGTNGQSGGASVANTKDGSTIYSLGTSVNIATSLLSQKDGNNNSMYGVTYTHNFSGNTSGTVNITSNSATIPSSQTANIAWKPYTYTVNFTFDQESFSTTRPLQVTGIPYNATPPKNSGSNPWSVMEGNITWNSSYVDLYYSFGNYPRIGSPTFNIPADTKVTVSAKVRKNNSGLNGNLVISLGSDDHKYVNQKLKKSETYESSFEATMTSSLKVWRIQYTYMAAGPRTYVDYFRINYKD